MPAHGQSERTLSLGEGPGEEEVAWPVRQEVTWTLLNGKGPCVEELAGPVHSKAIDRALNEEEGQQGGLRREGGQV